MDDLPTDTFFFASRALISASVISGCSCIRPLTSSSCVASAKSL